MGISITGTVKQVLDEQSGTGKNGPWRKQEFILETEEQYPKPVCIIQWGDDIDDFGVQEGERLTAHVDIQSREYNGRWYTDVKAWRVERPGGSDSGRAPDPAEPWPEEPSGPVDEDDGLPF
jgi:hypothetical protein